VPEQKIPPARRVFALTGDIKNSGLIEIPMGIPLKLSSKTVGRVPKAKNSRQFSLEDRRGLHTQ